MVLGIVSNTESVGIGSDTGRVVVDGSSLVVVDSCSVDGAWLVAGRSLDEGTRSIVEGATL